MKYDFEITVSRKGVGAAKWDSMLEIDPKVPENIVPLSVADMELMNPPEIKEGLKQYLDQAVYGYTGPTEDYFDAVEFWMARRHGYLPKKEWFVMTPGIVPAVYQMVEAFTDPGDAVLLQTPVYYPFFGAIEKSHLTLVENPLVLCHDHYEIDFAGFEEQCRKPEVKLFILCSPHNPIGRVYTEKELKRMMEICLDNHVFVIADEIHEDLILPGNEYVSVGTLEEKYLQNVAICTAPSKTFNLAGFQTSNILIPNEDYRKKLQGTGKYGFLNLMGYKACEIAYNQCEDWLDQLLVHLEENRQLLGNFFHEKLPEVVVHPLQGTYLQWLDFRAYFGTDHQALEQFMQKKAYWFTDEGYLFGQAGAGFERVNIACTRKVLEEALDRLYEAMKEAFPDRIR